MIKADEKKNKRKYSLRTNIMMFLIIAVLVCFSVGIYNYILQRNSLYNMAQLINETRQMNQISTNINALQGEMDTYLKTRSSDTLQSYYDYRNLLLEDTAALEEQIDGTDHGIKLKNLKGMLSNHLVLTEDVLIAKRNEKVSEYTSIYPVALESYDYIVSYIQEIMTKELENSTESYTQMQAQIRTQSAFSYTLFGASFALMILMVFLYSIQITKPLARLAEYASQVSEGNYDIVVENRSSDMEFDKLYDAFSVMIKNMRLYLDSINEKRQLERQLSMEKIKSLEMKASLQEAEYLALRSQMNPHFIFNTINIGAKIAMMEGDDKVSEYLEDAADVFRYTLQGLNEATLAEEIENVQAYMNLLTTRFGDKLKFNISLQEDIPLDHITMPRMTLQPLAENAYIHGISNGEDGGSIWIEIWKRQDMIQIAVCDTGGCFTDDKVAEVLEDANSDAHHAPHTSFGVGIGLVNVIKRLKLFFQVDEPVEIWSEGRETRIVISIPPGEEWIGSGGHLR